MGDRGHTRDNQDRRHEAESAPSPQAVGRRQAGGADRRFDPVRDHVGHVGHPTPPFVAAADSLGGKLPRWMSA